jgi:hypothetical protein
MMRTPNPCRSRVVPFTALNWITDSSGDATVRFFQDPFEENYCFS